jgi:hypothetical protein
LKGEGGNKVRQFGRNALVLDTRVTAVQKHLAKTMDRLSRDYDVDASKVDFCLTAAENGQPSGYPNDNVSEKERVRIHRDLFRAVRKGCDVVKQGVRLESYPLEHCAKFIDDVISGDLVGTGRSHESHAELNARLCKLDRTHNWVSWPEMVWGLGSDKPVGNPDWERTYLEWLATDINYERKLELSFPPFDYENTRQIRALMNLYASGGPIYKIVQAGTVAFDLAKLQDAGVPLSNANRFLAAPSVDAEVFFVVPSSCGRPSQWDAINLLRPERVSCVVRDENWEDGKRWHCVRFTGRGGDVYEIRPRSL